MRARVRESAGFTLLEILVVLTIIGLVAVLVPDVTHAGDGLRLRAEAHAMADDIRQVRAEAIRQGKTAVLQLDAHRYRLEPGGRERALSHETRLEFMPVVDRLLPSPDRQVAFYPDGSTSGGVLSVHHGALRVEIDIAEIDGAVQVRDPTS